jgi:hypothetical protein
MKSTTSQIIAAAVVTAIVVGALAYLLVSSHMPKDTPIVIIGGSIHHDIDGNDLNGWLARNSYVSYHGLVHRDPRNTSGIDYLAFNLFTDANNNPFTGPIQNTSGWAIKVTDGTTAAGVYICSDDGCSASSEKTGSDRCPGGFNPYAALYVGVIDQTKSRLQEKKNGGIINELRYHNKSGDCDGDGDNEGQCDMVTTMRVDTCTPLQSQTLKCAGKGCTLTIGKK